MAVVKYIESMDGYHERNIQTPRKQRRRVSAGQSGMSVDDINRLDAVKLLDSAEEASVKEFSGAGEPEGSGNLRIAHPIRGG